MTDSKTNSSELTLMQSVDELFLKFLVGKSRIYKEEDYNDGLADAELESKESDEDSESTQDGWSKRILLDVEKERVMKVKADKRITDKRNALLTRYFQQSLLKLINSKLENTDSIITEQLQLRDNTLELLIKLLSSEPRYSTLAPLLNSDVSTRNRLLSLVGSENFMAMLGRSARQVRDVQSAIGMIGTDVLRYLVPAILFKYRINAYSRHNVLFARKLWRYEITLGQTCTALMKQGNYRRPYEGMLLSVMVNFAYVACYQQYLSSFEVVRNAYLDQAREKGEKYRHDFFYDIQTDSASLQASLMSQSGLTLSLTLSESLFSKTFPHLVNALKEEVDAVAYQDRSKIGKILFKAMRFAKFDQLRASRLFKAEWLENYLEASHIDVPTYKGLLRQELFRFKAIW